MASSQKTRLGLNKWTGSDKAVRTDLVNDNEKIDLRLNPAGVIMMFGGATVPDGWLLCNGQAVSRTTYSDLFAAIGVAYGIGNGTTTFNVPDMRGRVPVGCDANFPLGNKGGEITVSLNASQNGQHYHSMVSAFGSMATSATTSGKTLSANDTAFADNHKNTNSAGSGAPHNNLPPYISVNYIIKT